MKINLEKLRSNILKYHHMLFVKLIIYNFAIILLFILFSDNIYSQPNYDSLYRIEFKNKKILENKISELQKSLNSFNDIFKINSRQEGKNAR